MFGYINDVSTAQALEAICDEHCATSSSAQRAAGYVLGWHDVRSEHARERVGEVQARLERRRRFWD